jgi:hypothetical protein
MYTGVPLKFGIIVRPFLRRLIKSLKFTTPITGMIGQRVTQISENRSKR